MDLFHTYIGYVQLTVILWTTSTKACTQCNGRNRYLPDRRKPLQLTTFKGLVPSKSNGNCKWDYELRENDEEILKTAPCPPIWNIQLICDEQILNIASCENIVTILRRCVRQHRYNISISNKLLDSFPNCRNFCDGVETTAEPLTLQSAGCDGVCIALLMFFIIVFILCLIFIIAYKRYGKGRFLVYRIRHSVHKRFSRNTDKTSSGKSIRDTVACTDCSDAPVLIPNGLSGTEHFPDLAVVCEKDADDKENERSSLTSQTEVVIIHSDEDVPDSCLLENYEYPTNDEGDNIRHMNTNQHSCSEKSLSFHNVNELDNPSFDETDIIGYIDENSPSQTSQSYTNVNDLDDSHEIKTVRVHEQEKDLLAMIQESMPVITS